MEDKEFLERIHKLEEKVTDPRSGLDIDGLLDIIPALCAELSEPALKRAKNVELFLSKYECYRELITSSRMKRTDFEPVKVIGRGAFGEVQVVRHRRTGQVLAMKTLSKYEMIKRAESAFFWEEREIMSSAGSEWIVKLVYAFQDLRSLYFVMEFMPGGDIATLISSVEVTEAMARFYCAEVALALDVIHVMGFIHRDVKPDNMLLDAFGHLKLADFGTCMRINRDGYVLCDVAVGTPDYISPEVLKSQTERGRYGRECDWWSVGIFLYEMLYGETPFYAESLVKTYANIMDHKQTLKFPDDNDVVVSDEAKAFISALLTDQSERLGRRGTEEVKAHGFFVTNEWTWDDIRNRQAPFCPQLSSEVDTTYFDHAEKETSSRPPESFLPSKTFVGNHLPFVGFSYNSTYKLLLGPVNGVSPRKSAMVGGDAELRLRQESAHRQEAESKLQQANRELERLNNAEKTLRADLKTYQRQYNQVQIDFKDAQIKYDTEIELHRKTEKRLKELEKEKRELADLASMSQSHANRSAELERELREVRDREHAESDAVQKMKRQLNDLQQQLASEEAGREKADSLLRRAEEQRQTVERDRQRLREQLLGETSAKTEALRRIDQLTNSNNELGKEVQRLRLQDTETGDALTKAKREVACLTKKVSDDELELSKLRGRLEKETRRQQQVMTSTPTSPENASTTSPSQHSPSSESVLTTSASSDSLLELQRRLDSEVADHQRTETLLSESQRRVADLDVEKSALAQDVRKYQAETARLSKDLEQLRGRFEAEQASMAGVRRELDDQTRLAQARQRSLDDADEEVRRLTSEKQRLHEELAKSKETVREGAARLKDVEHLLDTESMLNKMLKSQKKEMIHEFEQQKKRAEDLEAVRRNLLAERESLSSEFTQLRRRAEAESIARALAEGQATELRRDREDLTAQVAELKEKLRSETEHNDAAVADWSTKFDDSLMQIARLTNEGEADKAEIRKLKMNLETEQAAKRATIEKLAGQLNVDALAGVGGKHAKSAFGKTNFEAEYKRKKEECLRLQKDLKEAGHKHQNDLSRLQREVDMLREQLAEESQRAYRLQVDNESRQADVVELENRLKQMQLSSDTVSLGSSNETSNVEARSATNSNATGAGSSLVAGAGTASPQSTARQHLADELAGSEPVTHQSFLLIPKGRNLKKDGWLKVWAVLTTRRLLMFESEQAQRDGAEPVKSIEFERFYHVRKVNQGDVCRTDPENIPKIFQVMYDPTSSSSSSSMMATSASSVLSGSQAAQAASSSTLAPPQSGASLASLAAATQATMSQASIMSTSMSMSGSSSSGLGDLSASLSGHHLAGAQSAVDTINYKGHHLIKMPAPRSGGETGSCDFCHRAFGGGGLAALFSKSSVLQCKTCHARYHNHHVDKKEELLPVCKVHAGGELAQDLLFMAGSAEDQAAWVDRLLKRIPKRGKPGMAVSNKLVDARGDSATPGGRNAARRGSSLSTSSSLFNGSASGQQRPTSPPALAEGAIEVVATASTMPSTASASATTGLIRPQPPVPSPKPRKTMMTRENSNNSTGATMPPPPLSPKHV